jgi:hypothetical protein
MTLIAQAIDASGGSISWENLLAAVPQDKQRHFIPALKTLERNGTYKREVRSTPEGASFAVVKVPV